MAGPHLLPELVHRIDGRVHVAPKTILGVSEGRHYVGERRAADDREVDVARGPHRALRRRPVDERDLDRRRNRDQRLADQIDGADGLQEELLQLGKDRRRAIRLKIYLPAIHRPRHEAGARQQLQLALHGALSRAGQAHELAQIESLIRMPVQPCKHLAPRLSKEKRTGIWV